MKSLLPLIEHAQTECSALGVSLVFHPGELTRAGDQGEFDNIKKRLVVCVEHPHWPYVLAHELGHMDDWRLHPEEWPAEPDDYGDFNRWLAGEASLPPRKLLHLVRRIQRCEHYAERHALKLLRRFGHPKVETYVKKANFGLWQYEASRQSRRWIEATPAGEEAMPDRLLPLSRLGDLPVGFGG